MPDDNGTRRQAAAPAPEASRRDASGELPPTSRAPHVTLSGGLLSGLDVVLTEDSRLSAPEKIEVGAQVELQDGTRAEVVKVRGKLLSAFGVLEGGIEVRLDDGTLAAKRSSDIAAVLVPAGHL